MYKKTPRLKKSLIKSFYSLTYTFFFVAIGMLMWEALGATSTSIDKKRKKVDLTP